ncbi:MAG: hypothetical protein IJQ65_01625, partial [Kiritimatiellae bacterium]|nr:hypothetical protein [Kiritimatiellia bacterium]
AGYCISDDEVCREASLQEIVRRGKVPCEVKVRSARMFRMLRPLCMELPFKLSLHEKLDHLQ